MLWAAFGSPDFGCGPGQVKASLVCLIANLTVDFSEGDDFKKGPDSLAQVHHVWAREMCELGKGSLLLAPCLSGEERAFALS